MTKINMLCATVIKLKDKKFYLLSLEKVRSLH